MTIRYLIFDLDETLYRRDAGVMQTISRLIRQYIVERYGLTYEEADALARRYHAQYGTSMRGLLLHNNLDPDDFLAYVHNFPLEDKLSPDPALDAMLASLPGTKVIFTNADRRHAERVLERLGVRHHFSQIVDVTAVNYISKPNPQAYQLCLQRLGARPEECVMIEDSGRNLAPAAALGITTVLVDGAPEETADYRIDDILALPAVIETICRQRSCA